MQLYADQGAYAAVCRPRSLCSCMQTKEPICSCMQTKEHIQLYADQGAYAAVCRASDFELHGSRDANVVCAYLL